ncbi:MAG: hypothetical protein HY980_02525 [Candidatus Magasanikbacteria bacterium]|nr:hypothetical protein [Candidatus Magasanikbacteria bacterium]
MSKIISSSVSVATEYVVVRSNTSLLGSITPENITAFQRDIMLQTQGEAVELSDGLPLLISALTLATIYDIAKEAVLHLNNGALILLFDHQSVEQLRPEEVDESVWTEMLKVKNKSIAVQDISCPTREVMIDLSAIWDNTRAHDDIIARTKLFIKSLAKYLKPGLTIHLRGEVPCLPLLTAIYLMRPYGHTIDYTDAQSANVILFS